jgi:hypothetical protein
MEAIGILILVSGVTLCGTSVERNVIYGLFVMVLGLVIIHYARKKEAKRIVNKPIFKQGL